MRLTGSHHAWREMIRSFLIIFFVILIPTTAHAEEATIGVSFGWVNFDGDNINPLQSDVKIGLSLAVKSWGKYLEDSRFGYYFEYGLDTYEAENTNEWGLVNTQTINTSVSGFYLHYTPTFFYDFTKGSSADWSFKIGAGLGISYFTVDGTMIFNQPSPVVQRVNDDAIAISKGIVFRYETKNIVIQAKEYMPTGKIQGVEMELQLPLITIAYKYDF